MQWFLNCGTCTTSGTRRLQGGGRIGLLFLHKIIFTAIIFIDRILLINSWVFVYFPCWLWKWPQKFSQPLCSCRNCFQTFDQIIFGTLSFTGTRWYVLAVRDPQMVRDQKKFGNHWLNANKKLLTACQPWNHDNHHPCMGFRCYRCHGQLSRTCVPNLSGDYFNQSCWAKGKITLAVTLPHIVRILGQFRESTG